MAEEGGREWLHPATVMQALLEGACYNGYYMNVYTITLCSTAPLHHDHIRLALTHLFRKVPVMRLCFRRRAGLPWACFMDHEEIDFQVVEGETADQVTEELGTYTYNVDEGPLWCARLLPHKENMKVPREELAAAFPHTCTLALGSNHVMSDGTTNVQIIDFFLQILDDVVSGKDIDDSKEMREYKGAKELDELLNAQDKELEKDPESLNILLQQHKYRDAKKSLVCHTLPTIQGVPQKTKFIEIALEQDTSSKFIERCKENGITVNSGFVALLNVSLVDFMREAGLEQEEYPLKVFHAISMRRYLPGEMSDILGAHTSILGQTVITPATWQHSFWDYAKRLHREIYNDLESKPITYLCVSRRLFYYEDSFRDIFSGTRPPTIDYIAATMGNLDSRIPTEGDHVRIGHLVRFTTNSSNPMMHMYHSFRGRFLYLLAYSVHLMTTETAQKLVDLVVRNFKSQV